MVMLGLGVVGGSVSIFFGFFFSRPVVYLSTIFPPSAGFLRNICRVITAEGSLDICAASRLGLPFSVFLFLSTIFVRHTRLPSGAVTARVRFIGYYPLRLFKSIRGLFALLK